MKILKAATLILFVSTPCIAQFQKSDTKIGLSAGYASQTASNYQSLLVNPHIGYFISNKFMVYTEGNIYHIFSSDPVERDKFNPYNTFDMGLGLAYTVVSSPKCGDLILGSGLYKRRDVQQLDWFITPRLSFDMGNYYFEATSDISVIDLMEKRSIYNTKQIYSTFEMGVFWKL